MNKLEIKYININDIKPYKKNPRINENAIPFVMESIKKFGFKNPVILDKNNVIVCGHTRIKSAEKLGIKEIPCIYADDLTEEQVKAFRLADNKVSEKAEWDLDLLNDELFELKELDFDMDVLGFENVDLNDEEQKEIVEDDVPELPKEAITKYGDIWQLGEHRLMCGDSTKKEDVEKLMDGKKADLVFTDPPYGMNLDTDWSGAKSKQQFYQEKSCKGTGNKYDKVIGDNEDFKPALIETIFNNFNYCKEIFTFGADYYAEYLPNKNDGSWIVWDKRSNDETKEEYINQSDKMFGSCFELCWSKNKHKRDIARVKWAGIFGTETEFDRKRIHPTQKPSKLVAWFLNKYSNENDIVADLYGGSGSTLIACEQLNRKCYMMELDPKYCDVIITRWETLTGKKAELIKE